MRKILLMSFLVLSFVIVHAQEEEEQRGFDRSKLFIGGNFGMSFGNSTFINVSPQVGYRFKDWFAAGTGLNFQYASFRSRNFSGATVSRENYGVVGVNIFGRVYPLQQVLLQVQPEMNYTWGKYKLYGPPDVESSLAGKFVPSVLLGAGGAIPMGRGAMIIMAQYDILQNERTPYGNRVFYNFGYNVGF
ncbi:MAG: hypothetical protein ACXWV5_03410 [Flavitalea sp.]